MPGSKTQNILRDEDYTPLLVGLGIHDHLCHPYRKGKRKGELLQQQQQQKQSMNPLSCHSLRFWMKWWKGGEHLLSLHPCLEDLESLARLWFPDKKEGMKEQTQGERTESSEKNGSLLFLTKYMKSLWIVCFGRQNSQGSLEYQGRHLCQICPADRRTEWSGFILACFTSLCGSTWTAMNSPVCQPLLVLPYLLLDHLRDPTNTIHHVNNVLQCSLQVSTKTIVMMRGGNQYNRVKVCCTRNQSYISMYPSHYFDYLGNSRYLQEVLDILDHLESREVLCHPSGKIEWKLKLKI